MEDITQRLYEFLRIRANGFSKEEAEAIAPPVENEYTSPEEEK